MAMAGMVVVAEAGDGKESGSFAISPVDDGALIDSLSTCSLSLDVLTVSSCSDAEAGVASSAASVTFNDLWTRFDARSGLLVGAFTLSLAPLLRAERRGAGEGLSTFCRLGGGPSLVKSAASPVEAASARKAAAGLADDRSASLVSLLGSAEGILDSLAIFRLPVGSELARSWEPRGVGSEFRLACLLALVEFANSSAVGGPMRAAAAFMASLSDAARGVGGILTRPMLDRTREGLPPYSKVEAIIELGQGRRR